MSDFTQGGVPVGLPAVLNRREARSFEIEAALSRVPVVVSFKLNIPGPIKASPTLNQVFEKGLKDLFDALDGVAAVVAQEVRYEATGAEALLEIEGDGIRVKRATADVEHDGLGRLYDMDVVTRAGAVSRKDLGLMPRKCFICDKDAKICGASRAHSVVDMQDAIDELIRCFLDR
ncbi:citrate lyase holo-[acyl-carrier protein] synthase [Peptoniphilus equinus]|uniref:citrate lyase holo-[acyl-carrier protein] synthase n=1 Tax=Peptoniphilus equinus TaxID=3016343 RepID=A0ABY7QUU2_9FIRM|nr:citrate lyase holo-[acyl-carrier protein] synthase [Peptoniphilus equinus]WBW49663.1 citrate lyase holo-[acyl-carrier protein] synthase [Peptoniphilus equinus]